jgi:hypothetical protein
MKYQVVQHVAGKPALDGGLVSLILDGAAKIEALVAGEGA